MPNLHRIIAAVLLLSISSSALSADYAHVEIILFEQIYKNSTEQRRYGGDISREKLISLVPGALEAKIAELEAANLIQDLEANDQDAQDSEQDLQDSNQDAQDSNDLTLSQDLEEDNHVKVTELHQEEATQNQTETEVVLSGLDDDASQRLNDFAHDNQSTQEDEQLAATEIEEQKAEEPEVFAILPEDTYLLSDEQKRLARSKDIRVLAHLAWEQDLEGDIQEGIYIRSDEIDSLLFSEVETIVKVKPYQTNTIAKIDVIAHNLEGDYASRITSKKVIGNNKSYYFDHPDFGMIIRVVRIEKEQESEEGADNLEVNDDAFEEDDQDIITYSDNSYIES